jgi:mannose-6-phosphate isomerase-like protein (cupin superfamily)
MNANVSAEAANRRAIVHNAPDAEALRHGEEQMTFLLEGAETGGAVGLVERVVSPNFKSPPAPHTHLWNDFLGYIVEGRLVFQLDGEVSEVNAGGALYVPRGVYFRWWNPDPKPVRALFAYLPGGFELFFKDVIAATAKRADKLHDYDRTLSDITRLHDKYGIQRDESGSSPEPSAT